MSTSSRTGVVTRTELFPVVVIEFYTNDDEGLLAGFRDSERLMMQGRPWIVLRDLRSLRQMPTAKQRRLAAEWTAKHHDVLKRLCVAAVSIIPNPLLRGALQAIYWLTPPPMPEHVVATMEDALRMIERIGAESGLPVARAVEALRAAG